MDASERLMGQIEDVTRRGGTVKFDLVGNNLQVAVVKMYGGQYKYAIARTICLDIEEYRNNLTEKVIDKLGILEDSVEQQDERYKNWVANGRPTSEKKELSNA